MSSVNMSDLVDTTPHDKIFLQDCIEGMSQLPDDSVQLIVADPPYNLNKDFGPYKERERRDNWLPWSRKWLDE